jgi:hypothetical protein
MIKNANELQEFINSVRKKAFEDVANLIKSDAVEKDPYGNVLISQDGLIGLIQSIDAAKLKKQKEEEEDGIDNLA